MGGEDVDEDVAKRTANSMPYSSPWSILADQPKLARDPRKEVVGEVEANVMERNARGETGEGTMEASEATREWVGEEQGKESHR
jgi:hypothetical protein